MTANEIAESVVGRWWPSDPALALMKQATKALVVQGVNVALEEVIKLLKMQLLAESFANSERGCQTAQECINGVSAMKGTP